MKKNKENFKTIYKTEENLKELIRFQEELQDLINDYKYVWSIELLNSVEVSGVSSFQHSFSNFILVSNSFDINEIKRILTFKKNKRKIYINSINANLEFLKDTEMLPVFELKEIK